jgi:hypothetical protein
MPMGRYDIVVEAQRGDDNISSNAVVTNLVESWAEFVTTEGSAEGVALLPVLVCILSRIGGREGGREGGERTTRLPC